MRFISFIILCISFHMLSAQELNVQVNVKPPQAGGFSKIDVATIGTMTSDIKDFFNRTKWTQDDYKAHEKINADIQINVIEELSATTFVAEISVKSSRPVYNSTYVTPILNFLDKEVTFTYVPGQVLQRSDASFTDNLSSTMSFYAFLILGLDYDSFEMYGGENFFTLARDVHQNLPDGLKRGDGSWTNAGSNGRSKYFLIENILNPKLRPFRQVFYEYHRVALDNMYKDPDKSRAIMLSSIGIFTDINASYPNSYLLQLFNDSKHQELVEIFKAGDQGQKEKLTNLMIMTAPGQSNRYEALKK
jgi:hypothetical protein